MKGGNCCTRSINIGICPAKRSTGAPLTALRRRKHTRDSDTQPTTTTRRVLRLLVTRDHFQFRSASPQTFPDYLHSTKIKSVAIQNTQMDVDRQCNDCNFDIKGSRTKIHGPPDVLYQHYLRNNGYPEANNVDSLVAGMEAAKLQSGLIRISIRRLKAALASLEGEDSRITEVIAKYRIVLRPVHKLPSEILAKIFLFTLNPPVALDRAVARTYPPHSLNTSKPPWTLGQVCREWREVALGTPGLWSSVYFHFRAHDDVSQTSEFHAHRLRLQLQRSANHPLIVITTTPPKTTVSATEPLAVILSSHTDHIRHLRFDMNANKIPFTSLSSGLFRQLETLDIRILAPQPQSSFGATAVHSAPDPFEYASRLNRLVLSGDLNRFNLKLPYLQITSFCWCDSDDPAVSSLQSLYAVLSRLQNLQICRISIHPRTISSYPFSGILKPFLLYMHELELTCMTQDRPNANNGILTWLQTTSRLTHLTVFSSGSNSAALSALFPQPRRMVFLVIQQVETNLSEFESALSKLTSLQTLKFGVSGGITDDFISSFQLTLPQSETFYVAPKLRHLALLATPGSESSYSDDRVVEMLETRRREASDASGNSRLTSFVHDRNVSDLPARERLDVLISNGLEVSEPRKWKGKSKVWVFYFYFYYRSLCTSVLDLLFCMSFDHYMCE